MTDLTRDEIETRAIDALDRLAMATGLDLSGARKAAILISLRGTGVTIVQIETACLELAICEKFDEKIRFGGTLTASDVFAKINEMKTFTTEGRDPVRALIDRQRKPTHIAELLPASGRKELPVGDRE